MLALPPSTGLKSNLMPNGLLFTMKYGAYEMLNQFFSQDDFDCPKLHVMNGQGVYINTIDKPNVVIIPEQATNNLK